MKDILLILPTLRIKHQPDIIYNLKQGDKKLPRLTFGLDLITSYFFLANNQKIINMWLYNHFTQ